MTQSKHQLDLLALFAQQPCWMIDPLAAELDCSVSSTRRYLNDTGYYSSFTHNGRWYTLRSIPRFNREGLWFHDLIGFSRVGSLTNTLAHLITRSPAGMSAEQLGQKLHCRCHSVLLQLCRQGKLERRKEGRAHIYLAADLSTHDRQLQALAGRIQPPAQLPAEIAVLILAEFIRNPKLSFKQLAQAVARSQHVAVKAAQIEALFARHDLKKTPPTAAP